jgi:hypothetical protein
VTSIGSTAYDILARNSVLAVASTLVDVNVMFLYTNVKVSYLVVTVMAWFNMVVGVVTSLRIVSGTLASDVITSVRIVSVEEVTVVNNVEAITFCWLAREVRVVSDVLNRTNVFLLVTMILESSMKTVGTTTADVLVCAVVYTKEDLATLVDVKSTPVILVRSVTIGLAEAPEPAVIVTASPAMEVEAKEEVVAELTNLVVIDFIGTFRLERSSIPESEDLLAMLVGEGLVAAVLILDKL